MNAIIQSLCANLGISEAEALDRMDGWEYEPIKSPRGVVGHLAILGNEIHTALYPEHHGEGRAVVRKYKELLAEKFFLTTRVPADDESGIAVTERVGFKEISRDASFIYYWLDESTLIGVRKCGTKKST